MRTLCWSFKQDAPGVCDARTGSLYADVDRPEADVDADEGRLVAVLAAVHGLAAAGVDPDVGPTGVSLAK